MGQLLIIPDLTRMDESFALAEEYGCAFEYNDFYLPAVLEDENRQKELIAAYRSVRTDFSRDTLHGAFFDVTVHSDDPAIREISRRRVRQSMDIAQALGVRGVVFHTGRLYGFRTTYYLEHWKKENREFFCKIAGEYPDIELYMENMFDEAPDVLAQFAGLMQDTRQFGVCLDYAHAALTQVGLDVWVSELAPYIRHIHINDNDLQSDLHLPVGAGRIDWEFYRTLMSEKRIDCPVLVEVRDIGKQRSSLQYMEQHRMLPSVVGRKVWE